MTTDLFYHHAKYGGDRALRAGCRRKCDVLFVIGRPAISHDVREIGLYCDLWIGAFQFATF